MKKLFLLITFLVTLLSQGQSLAILEQLRQQQSEAPAYEPLAYYILDGTDDYFTTDLSMETDFSGTNFSVLVEGRINLEEAGNYFLGNDEADADLRFYFDGSSTQRTTFTDNSLEAGNVKGTVSPYTESKTDWHQWLYTFDGTTNKVYLDGTLYDSETTSASFIGWDVGSPNLFIGKSFGTEYLNGDVKYIQWYDTDLSATDATNLVSNLDYNTTNLVVDFRDNKTATTWTDDVSGYVATQSGTVTLSKVPVIESYNTYTATLNEGFITLSKPDNVEVGDLLLMMIGNEDVSVAQTFPEHSGWVKQIDIGSGNFDTKMAIYWRIADGTEAATETITWGTDPDYNAGWYMRITGASEIAPIGVTSIDTQASGNTFTANGLTTVNDNSLVFAIHCFDGADGTRSIAGTTAAGWDDVWEGDNYLNTSGAASGWSGGWLVKPMVTAGASGDVDYSSSLTDGYATIQFAINPKGTEPTAIIPIDNLMAYYEFDIDGSDLVGTVDLTEIAGGNTTTYADAFNNGLSAVFDGVSGTGLETATTDFVFGNGTTDSPFSMSWIYKHNGTLGATGDAGAIMSKRGTSTTGEYQMMHYNSDWFFALFDNNSSTNTISALYNDIMFQNDIYMWQHMVVTYDGSGSNTGMEIYRNGELVTTSKGGNNPGSYVAMSTSTSKFTIGDPEWSTLNDVVGNVNEFAVWDKELSADEIRVLYHKQITEQGIWGYEPEYQLVLENGADSAYVKPSLAQRTIQNGLVDSLKVNGIWAKEDILYVPAQNGSKEFGYINWKDPGTFNLINNGTTTWTSNVGFAGDNSTGYFNTQYNNNNDRISLELAEMQLTFYVNYQDTNPFTNDAPHYFTGAQEFSSSNSQIHLYVDNSSASNRRMMWKTNSIQSGILNSANDGYEDTMITTVRSDVNFATNTHKLLWGTTEKDSEIDATEPFDHVYDQFINAKNSAGTATDFSDVTWGYFGLGDSQYTELATKNTLLTNYIHQLGDIYSQNNAASRWNEVNATTGWSVEATGTIISQSADKNHGTYALEIETTSGAGTENTYAWYEFNATAGDTYTVYYDMKRSVGTVAYGRAFAWQNVDTSPDTTPTSSWASYSADITVTATGAVELRFYSSASSSLSTVGDILLVDNFKIIKTN